MLVGNSCHCFADKVAIHQQVRTIIVLLAVDLKSTDVFADIHEVSVLALVLERRVLFVDTLVVTVLDVFVSFVDN